MAFPIERVLFLCVANSARSQLAEALTRHHLSGVVTAQSAGSAPSRVNPLAVAVLDEIDVSAAGLSSKHVDTIDPSSVDLVITLCAEEECPVFLADVPRISWQQPDPDRKDEDLSDEERRQHFRVARDAILGLVQRLAEGVLYQHPGLPTVRLHRRGFVEMDHTGVLTLDLATANHAIETVNAVLTACNWPMPFVVLVDLATVKLLPRDARQRYAESDGRTAKIGLLAGNAVTRVLGNFFLRLQNPQVPTRLFSNAKDAADWLLK